MPKPRRKRNPNPALSLNLDPSPALALNLAPDPSPALDPNLDPTPPVTREQSNYDDSQSKSDE